MERLNISRAKQQYDESSTGQSHVLLFRPAYIQPLHGIQSKTRLYRVLLVVTAPLYPLWRVLFPNYVTTTEQLGRAMIQVAKHGASKHILESRDIAAIV